MNFNFIGGILLLFFIPFWFFTGGETKMDRPNILFVIMDDATYSHFSAYGCSWVNTPNFDHIAKEGILFTNAYTPNAKCGPSRSAILTGRNSWQLEEGANHWCNFPSKFKTYTEALAESGYNVGFTGKGWAPGNPGKIDGKLRELTGVEFNKIKLKSPTSEISSIDYSANFAEFLNAGEDHQPFLFWVGALEPHRAYEYGSGISVGKHKIDDVTDRYPFWPNNDTVATDLLDYAFEIEYFDQHLGQILRILEDQKLLDNTLVIVTSDNGMPFPRVKGQEYELSNHMPLAAMWPNGIKSKGRFVEDFVSFIDFAPTFLELAGVGHDKSGMEAIEGRSLARIFRSEKSGKIEANRDHVLIGKERHDVGRPNDEGYPIRGIVKGDYLLIQNFETNRWPAGNPETGYLNCDGGPTKTICLNAREDLDTFHFWQLSFGKRPTYELYNISSDKYCLNNLSHLTSYNEVLNELKNQMYAELIEQEDPRIIGNGQIFENYPYANDQGINFHERYLKGEKLNSEWVRDSDFRPIE